MVGEGYGKGREGKGRGVKGREGTGGKGQGKGNGEGKLLWDNSDSELEFQRELEFDSVLGSDIHE